MATRSDIRTAIISLLPASAFTSTFDYCPSQLFVDELPAVAAYFTSGDSEYDFSQDAETDALLIVEITLRDAGNIDAALDAKAKVVGEELRANPTLDGLVGGLKRTNFNYDRDDESSIGILQLTYSVNYDDED
tara:strand:- start:529 stop:927 length:399 start_codon:yes stop_codon:yes gene_type:complete